MKEIVKSILTCKSRFFIGILIFAFTIEINAQIVPYYPVEIFFCPAGYTNNLPGCDPNLYTTFSSLKVVLNKDLPSPERFSNTIALIANIIKYHNMTKSKSYHPLSLNPVLTTHFFATETFTLGIDIVGNMEFLPGMEIDPEVANNVEYNLQQNPELASEFQINNYINTFNYQNYRFRIRPFHYVILTPNFIMQNIFTYGRSYNSDKVARINSQNKFEQVSNDYWIIRYELNTIYFTKFHTRIFLIPYYYKTQYYDIAINENRQLDKTLPKLREDGFGCTIGIRYMTFRWGFAEGAFEYERNIDMTNGGNSYTKLKFNAKWENQYFTERFGYLVIFDLIKYISEGDVFDFKGNTNLDPKFGQLEIRADVMPIFNINRNVSIRPELDIVYREYTDGQNTMKYRYWLHLHILF